MSQDLFQIALEHHRAGRLGQAENGYRTLLRGDPHHADALHWLGVLLLQAGAADQAVGLLERAAAARPTDAAFHHNLAQAYLHGGQTARAIDALERAATLDPGRGQTHLELGLARLARRGPGDAEAAVSALIHAHAAGLESADVYHHLGVALLTAGQADEAAAAFLTALEKKPDYAAAYHHLALAYRCKGDAKEVRKNLNKSLELDPSHAPAWCALGVLETEASNLSQAAAMFRRAIRAKGDYAAAYRGLGLVLQKEGKQPEAMSAFGHAMKLSREGHGVASTPGPADEPPATVAELERKLNSGPVAALHYQLAVLADVFPPPKVPAAAVAAHFDSYANEFDQHLVGRLDYHVPELIVAAVTPLVRATAQPGQLLDVMDLGCGTGLCGPLLRPMAATLRGVDLSPAMVEKARARGTYDAVEVADLVAALRRAPDSFDLVVAADVLVYVGDLAPAFEAAAAALRPGGLLAFSVEAGGGDRYHMLKAKRRFVHSKPYLQRLAAMFGFREESFSPIVPRTESNEPVQGFLVVLRKPLG